MNFFRSMDFIKGVGIGIYDVDQDSWVKYIPTPLEKKGNCVIKFL